MGSSETLPLTGSGSEPLYTVKFHVEKIRMIAQISFVFMISFCDFITNKYIMGVTEDPHETVIYKLFGFNHSCNALDYNPAKLIAAILVPLISIPYVAYSYLFHLRLVRGHKRGDVSDAHLMFSRITLPFNIVAYALLHLWFVNGPNDDYGFAGHYLPYVSCQFALFFSAINQVLYLKATDNMPFGVPKILGDVYIISFAALLAFNQTLGLSITFGHPVIDTASNPTYANILHTTSTIFVFGVFIAPIIFAWEESKNKDDNIITFA